MWAASVTGTVLGSLTVALGVYGPELFSTRHRARANGLIVTLGVAGSATGLLVVGMLADRFGSYGPAFTVVAIGPVLAAVLPGAALRDAEKLLSERAAAPFASAGDFASRAGTILRREVAAGPAPRDFRVVSEYFAAVLDVALDDQRQSRMIWLHRSLSSGTVTETYRMTLP